MKPFSFLADAFDATSARELGERARAAEDLGVTTFVLPDHLVPQLAPVPYLATVAALTRADPDQRVRPQQRPPPPGGPRPGSRVARRPVGRPLDVAIGAGWNEPEYRAIGLPFDPIRVRQARLAEAITVIKGCFGPRRSRSPASTTRSPTTTPTRSRSSSRTSRSSSAAAAGKTLELAAREADIVGLAPRILSGQRADPRIDHLGRDRGEDRLGPRGRRRSLRRPVVQRLPVAVADHRHRRPPRPRRAR